MRVLIKTILLSSILTTQLIAIGPKNPDSLVTSIKKNLGNFLCYFITSSEVSEETTAYAQDLMKKIDPNQKITCIQKFNAFGEYLFGSYNAIALPILNYVILNTKSLKKLHEETQRFAIGRTLYYMANSKDYLTYNVLLPLIYDVLFQINESPAVKDALSRLTPRSLMYTASQPAPGSPAWNAFGPPDDHAHALRIAGRNSIYHILAALHIAYASRHIEWEADVQTAKILNCPKGGIEFFKHYQKSTGDGTFLGGASATIPLFELLNEGAHFLLKIFTPRIPWIKEVSINIYGMNVAQLQARSFISQLKDITPGQLMPHSNQFTEALSLIPLLNYFCHSASSVDRIAALEKLIQKPY